MSGTKRFERSGQPATAQSVDWPAIERSSEFQELVQTRRRFLAPLTVVFLIGSIGYLLLMAFVPDVMGWQIVDGLPFAWVAADEPGAADLGAVLGVPAQGRQRDFEPLEQRAAAVAERSANGGTR